MSYKKKQEPTKETKSKDKETLPDPKKNQFNSAKTTQQDSKTSTQKQNVATIVAAKNQESPKNDAKTIQKQDSKPKQEVIIKSKVPGSNNVQPIQKQVTTAQPVGKQEASPKQVASAKLDAPLKQEVTPKQETIIKSKVPGSNTTTIQKFPSAESSSAKPFTNTSIPFANQGSSSISDSSISQEDSKAKILRPDEEKDSSRKGRSVSIERGSIKTVLAVLFGIVYPFFGLFLYTGLSLEGIRLYEDLMLQVSTDPYDTLFIWVDLLYHGNIIEEVSVNGFNAFYSQPTMAIAFTWTLTTYFMAVVLKSFKKVLLATIFIAVFFFAFYSIFAVLSGNMMTVFDTNINQTVNGLITMAIFAVPGAIVGFFVGRE